MNRKSARISINALVIIIALQATAGWCQKINSRDRDTVQSMLQEISTDIRKHYYDPKFHGVDWDAEVDKIKQKINGADSLTRAVSEVAVALDSLNDSHTFFLPPAYSERYVYGWQVQMIGDRCFVARVRPGSDAEKKGVKPGDELVALNGFSPNRDSFWRMQYFFNTLHPQPEHKLDLRNPAGETRQVDVVATVIKKKPILDLTAGDGANDIWDVIRQGENDEHDQRVRFIGVGDVGVLKFPSFFADASQIDSMIGKADKYKTVVLDLRRDPGGSVETLQYLTGGFFEKEIKIGDRVGRSKQKPLISKGRYHPFTGKLIVLVDSKSASCAELFARVVQIEKRGTVIGDHSSGSVMEAKEYSYKAGTETVVFYGASITDANIIMTDGKSLEHQGVVPDELMLPSAEDMANGRDPVLAHAIETGGGKITPEAAGKLFPYEWPAL